MRICPQCGTGFQEPIQFCPHDGSQTYEAVTDQAPPADPLLGRVIDGRYRIEQKIGEGGMGMVYMAVHTVLQKKLALKVLRGDHSHDADVVQRFMQEAQAATSIGHPNIVDISDFGRLPDGSVYFVMEYLDGGSLSDLIKKGGSVPPQEAIHLVRQIASALDAAHARGIVHRDLKPDNILIIRQGADPRFVKVLDFGVAKVGGAASKLTKTGMVFGTPHYMSPEQAAGHSVDQRTDIYALGIIMYEMFSGKVPFDADTFMGILSKHMFEVPARPTMNGASLGALEGIILRTLEKNPDHRYPSMGQLVVDLDTIAAGGTVSVPHRSAVAPPPSHFGAALVDPALPRASETSTSGETSSKSALLVVLATAVLVVVGVGVGLSVFLLTGHEDEGALVEVEGTATAPVAAPSPTEPAAVVPATALAPTVPAPAPSPEAEPPAPAAPVVISIQTDPPGAEVLLEGVMVGNTPVSVPRPSSGTQPITLRLRDHEESTIQISPQSSTSLSVTLARQRHVARTGAASPAARRPLPTPMIAPMAPTQSPPPFTRTPPRRGSAEVVDPWE